MIHRSLRTPTRLALVAGALFASTLSLAVAPTEASAEDAPAAPSPEDIARAKEAFGAGKALFDEGKFDLAVDKFKESYRLSRNPLLLYNIALTLEKLGIDDKALFYYRKFLDEAPKNAAQRPDAERSAKALGKKIEQAELEGGGATPPPGDKPAETKESNPSAGKPSQPKRGGPYTEADVQHIAIEEAPPGKPLDLTVSLPGDSGWEAYLFIRGAGEEKFTEIPMRARYKELVGRVPAERMAGNALQYYIEVKDYRGELVTRLGKPASPNVVFLDESASPSFYADLEVAVRGSKKPKPRVDDDAGGGDDDADGGGRQRLDDDEDPLSGGRRGDEENPLGDDEEPGGGEEQPGGAGSGGVLRWTATGVGGGFLLGAVAFHFMAGSWASSVEAEAEASRNDDCPAAPCRTWDDYRKSLQTTGQRYELLSRISLGVGLAAGAAAGYLWYRELTGGAKRPAESEPVAHRRTRRAPRLDSLVITPALGDGFVGGAAAMRF